MMQKTPPNGTGPISAAKSHHTFANLTPMPTFIAADVVAEMIGYTDGSEFLRNRERLERDDDFPLPIPTCKRPLKWRTALISAWVSGQGLPTSQMQARVGPRCNHALLKAAQRA